MTIPHQPRPHCYRCDKPRSMCICAYLRPLPNTVGVHVLQHPRERRHPLGTARLLRLGLATVQVHVLRLLGQGGASTPVSLPAGAGLLYPSADALDLATLSPDEQPRHLVVIDGTWPQANRVYRDNAWVSSLPHYRLDPAEGSRYRIRAEPRLECLSTVESVVAALRCLQPELRDTEMLDAAFDAMIDAQIQAQTDAWSRGSTHVRSKRPRHKPLLAVPAPLMAPDASIVIVHAEAEPHRPGDTGPRNPVRLSATTLNGARVFDRFIQTRTPPDALQAERWGIGPEELAAAQPLSQSCDALDSFCTNAAATVLVSWDVWTYRWLERRGADTPLVLLKGVWSNLNRAGTPALREVVSGLGLTPQHLPVSGRAGQRLTDARAMACHIVAGESDA